MNTDLRNRFLSVVFFFVLIASAVFTVPARADSGSPPPAPTAPGGSTHGASQVPSGGANTSGGDQGHKVELSSQNAAYIAPAGDPIWCPSGVAVPVPGASGCSANYANLYLLTNDVENGIIHPLLTNSNIWIQHGADLSPNQPYLDGSVLPLLSNFSLNFKGGWNGLGTGSVNQATPSTFTQGLEILNWKNNITLSDVQFNNVVAGTGEGIYITTKGNISLTRVQANMDRGYGAYLNNTSGTGFISIMNSQFNGDAIPTDPHALEVRSNNAITLTNVLVDNGWGAYLDNRTGANKPVIVKSSYFDNNQFDGLQVLSTGAVTLTNISATGNYGVTVHGAQIDNTSSSTAAPVTLTGTNTFDSNADFGLTVFSKGKITSASLHAGNNGSYGALFDNHTAASLPVTLTGLNNIYNNAGDGLELISSGAILTNGLLAFSNSNYGVFIYNYSSTTSSPVTLKGINIFNFNASDGLNLTSKGSVVTNGLTAISNNGNGVYIDNTGSSTFSPVTLIGLNTFDKNNSDGLFISSNGKLLISGINASGNSSDGAIIDNHTSAIFAPLTLNGFGTFNFNSSDGVYLASMGPISTNGLIANFNSSDGAFINNDYPGSIAPVTMNGINNLHYNGSDGLALGSKGMVLTNNLNATSNGSDGVNIDNSSSIIFAPITVKGINNFNNNGSNGLDIGSEGKVVTNNLSAINNGSNGVSIGNTGSGISAPVILSGLNILNGNGSFGLQVDSKGAITTNNLTASYNASNGVYLENTLGATGIIVSGKNVIWDNRFNGLVVFSNGAVTVSNISSKWNDSDGLLVSTAGNVLVSCGSFISNGTGHVSGYGWETGVSVPSIKLIGVTSAGNFSGDSNTQNLGTLVIKVPHPCSLP